MVSQDEQLDAGLKAVADATRRGILVLLGRGQLSVQEIAESFPVSRPAISKHLRILREAGLVVEKPVGRQRLYALERAPLESLSRGLAGLNGHRPRFGRALSVRSRRVLRREDVEDWRVW